MQLEDSDFPQVSCDTELRLGCFHFVSLFFVCNMKALFINVGLLGLHYTNGFFSNNMQSVKRSLRTRNTPLSSTIQPPHRIAPDAVSIIPIQRHIHYIEVYNDDNPRYCSHNHTQK